MDEFMKEFPTHLKFKVSTIFWNCDLKILILAFDPCMILWDPYNISYLASSTSPIFIAPPLVSLSLTFQPQDVQFPS